MMVGVMTVAMLMGLAAWHRGMAACMVDKEGTGWSAMCYSWPDGGGVRQREETQRWWHSGIDGEVKQVE